MRRRPSICRSAAPIVAANFNYAEQLLNDIRRIPGIADARIQQSRSMPAFNVDVDRTRAQYAGVTERDVTNSLVVNLAGSGQVSPTFWLNPQNGVQYPIVMQTPQYQLDDLSSVAEPADHGHRYNQLRNCSAGSRTSIAAPPVR